MRTSFACLALLVVACSSPPAADDAGALPRDASGTDAGALPRDASGTDAGALPRDASGTDGGVPADGGGRDAATPDGGTSDAPPACTETIASDLVGALERASDGDVLCLAEGTYAAALFGVTFDSDVTVRPADGADVSIGGFRVDACRHLRFTGLGGHMRILGIDVDGVDGNPASRFMTFDHVELTEAITLRAREADMRWVIDRCTFVHIHVSLYEGAISVRGYDVDADQGIVISNNYFEGDGAINGTDGVQCIGGANGVVIRGNEFTRIDQHESPMASHADPIQIYGARNIVVDGNYFHDNAGTGGLEDFDGPNPGMVVIHNVFEAHRRGGFIFPWAIAANAAQGWRIEHNTFFGEWSVRIDGEAADNVVRDNVFAAGAGVSLDGGGSGTAHDHNLQSGLSGDGELSGMATFIGGAMPTTYEGYALAAGSAGEGASSTGSDLGAFP